MLITVLGPTKGSKGLSHCAGIFFGFGWEGAFHMALHELHLDRTVQRVTCFALAQMAILLPAYFGVINNRLCELEKDDEVTRHVMSFHSSLDVLQSIPPTMKEDERFTDTVDFCARMFDWHRMEEQFKQRGVNVTGPDKHVVMSRALAAYRLSKAQDG